MFNNQRYITSGVQAKLPEELVLYLWILIDERMNQKLALDYLQVFELRAEHTEDSQILQVITHRQEQPPYEKIHKIRLTEPVATKLFCIDDGHHSTLLLTSEY